MQSATATVFGTITQKGADTVCDQKTSALGEASVSLRSGSSTYTVTSASVGDNCGKYEIQQVPPTVSVLLATVADVMIGKFWR